MELDGKTYCKRCTAFGNNQEEILSTLNQYILSLDQTIKVDEKTYQKRLAVCETCTKLIGGLCSHCGCYVMVRGIKTNQRCPHPSQDYWAFE